MILNRAKYQYSTCINSLKSKLVGALNLPDLILLIIYILILIFLFRNLDFAKMWAYGDLNPSSIKFMISQAFYAWNDEGLGLPNVVQNHINILISIILAYVTGEIQAQKIYIILIFIITYITMFYVAKQLLNLSGLLSFISAILYSINPFTVRLFVDGFIGELTLYAVTPLVFYFYIKYLNTFKSIYILFIALLYPFYGNLYTTFWVLTLLILSITIAYFIFISKQNIWHIIKGIILLLILFILLLLPTLIEHYYAYSGKDENIKNIIIADVKWNYKDATLIHLLRYAGDHGSAQSYLGYNSINYFTWIGMLFEIFVVISLLLLKKINNDIKLVVVSSWISLLISITIIETIRSNPELATSSLILGMLRSPVKLMQIIALNLTILAIITLKYIYEKFEKHIISKVIITIILVLLIFLYNLPAMDGKYGLSLRDDFYLVDEKLYMLPHILKQYDQNYENKRILFMPFDYDTLIKLRSVLLNYFGIRPALYSNTTKIEQIYNSLISMDQNIRDCYLKLFNVKFIIINMNFKSPFEWYYETMREKGVFVFQQWGAFFIGGNISQLSTLYLLDNNTKIVYEDSSFIIFQTKFNVSKFYILYELNHNNNTKLDKLCSNIHPVSFNQESPTKYTVNLTSDRPFILIFAESYNPMWVAEIYKDNKIVQVVRAQPFDSLINNFSIETTGNLTINIYFALQNIFEKALASSLATYILIVLISLQYALKEICQRRHKETLLA